MMSRKLHIAFIFSLALAISFLFTACEKEIDLQLEDSPPQLVVNGIIEPGSPPIVVLTQSSNYWEPLDITAVSSLFLHGATITVNNGTSAVQLTEVCSTSVDPSLLPLISQILGLNIQALKAIDFCIYTNSSMLGEVGKNYALDINYNNENFTSSTVIPTLVPLDSTWFTIWGGTDSLGYAWANLTDPAAPGNNYRWYAKRINKYTYGANKGQQKDGNFIPPRSSVVDDKFFNGLSFEFAYDRGSANGSKKDDDNNEEKGFFKLGDTIVVKFCSIDKGVYEFTETLEEQVLTAGNPFASPSNVPTNIEGKDVLGVWAGYGVTYDTIVAGE